MPTFGISVLSLFTSGVLSKLKSGITFLHIDRAAIIHYDDFGCKPAEANRRRWFVRFGGRCYNDHSKEKSMFYNTEPYREKLAPVREERTLALVVLTPYESRRLIARGVLSVPEVKRALENHYFIVSRGTTCAYLVDELTGDTLDKGLSTAGIITDGRLASTEESLRLGPWVFKKGKLTEETADEALQAFTHNDVSVKGVNAVDLDGNVGILAGNELGGTIGGIWPILSARGSYLFAPVGLEKLIPSVREAASKTGQGVHKYVMGSTVALMPVMDVFVVTEIQSLEMLTGVTATHVASGGVAGTEGAVTLALEGGEETVMKAVDLVKSIKGEPPFKMPPLEPPKWQ
jgi:hypothetical protein